MKTRIPTVLITIALACFALVQNTQAVSPPPDGGYPSGNTAEGTKALLSQTTGGYNAAIGWLSLESLTTASFNTGLGAGTLAFNNGDENTATGAGALLFHTTGNANAANGAFALFSDTSGEGNTATGAVALLNNITGGFNTATGFSALFSNTTGGGNTAIGFSAPPAVKEAIKNGADALVLLSSGTNVAGSTTFGSAQWGSNTTTTGGAYGNYFNAQSRTTGSGFGSSTTLSIRKGYARVIAIKFL